MVPDNIECWVIEWGLISRFVREGNRVWRELELHGDYEPKKLIPPFTLVDAIKNLEWYCTQYKVSPVHPVQWRLRNIYTNEIIPGEALGR